MMKFGFLYTLVLVVVLAGCNSSTTPDRQPSIDGITLADLRPAFTESMPPVMLFMITTYLVDESHLQSVRGCYDSLPQDSIRFLDKTAFEANGFFASYGSGMAIGPVGDCLIRMGAEQYNQMSLILDAGLESPFSETVVEEETITYVVSESNTLTQSLSNGVIGWELTARPDPTVPGRVRARIVPVFSPRGIMNWPGVERIAQKLSHRFDAVRFDVSLREADFVILGVNRDSIDELTSLERLLFLHPGKNGKVRLYAIMCVKAYGG
jgi:hypothetical protein